MTLIKFSLTLNISKVAFCSLSRTFELQEQIARRYSSSRGLHFRWLSFAFIPLSSTLFTLTLFSRCMSRHPVNAYHIYIIYRNSNFYNSSCPVFSRLLAFLWAAYISSDVVNGNDDGICWHDLLQGGRKESACCPPFMAWGISNVFFRRLYT